MKRPLMQGNTPSLPTQNPNRAIIAAACEHSVRYRTYWGAISPYDGPHSARGYPRIPRKMQTLSPEQSSLAQAAVVSLVTFAALALLGLVLAYWTWAWLAPRPEPRTQPAVTGARAEVAYGLFGNSGRDNGGGREGAATTGVAVGLLGIVAASGNQPSYAVLRLDAKQTVAVREGGEIEPGIRLAEVHADHVVLERSGVRETLAWPKPGKSAVPAVPRATK
jgi:general secretion pathway protein C